MSDSWLFRTNATTEVTASSCSGRGLRPWVSSSPFPVHCPANVEILRGLSGYDIYQAPERNIGSDEMDGKEERGRVLCL
jgi:hypothetical protein